MIAPYKVMLNSAFWMNNKNFTLTATDSFEDTEDRVSMNCVKNCVETTSNESPNTEAVSSTLSVANH